MLVVKRLNINYVLYDNFKSNENEMLIETAELASLKTKSLFITKEPVKI